jgi:hypothetical protein
VYSEGIVDDATIASYQEILSEVTKKQADREARKHKVRELAVFSRLCSYSLTLPGV